MCAIVGRLESEKSFNQLLQKCKEERGCLGQDSTPGDVNGELSDKLETSDIGKMGEVRGRLTLT